jgi:hypothetical protein
MVHRRLRHSRRPHQLHAGDDAGCEWESCARRWSDYAGLGPAINVTTSHPLLFLTGNTERMRLDTSGNLGLGVTPTTGGYGKGFQFSGDPASDLGTLWIQPINTNDHRVSLTNNAKNSGVGSWAYFASSQSATMYEQVAGQHRWTTAGTGTAGNAISFTQAMTLDASGNLGIGVTSPAVPLHVANSGTGLGTVGRFERLNGADSYTLNVNIDPDANVAELIEA